MAARPQVIRSAAAPVLLPLDRVADFPSGLANAAPDVSRELVALAPGAHVAVARRAADDLLRHTLDLLSDSLNFLLGCLSAERSHRIPSLAGIEKQELFRQIHGFSGSGNAGVAPSRLTEQEW